MTVSARYCDNCINNKRKAENLQTTHTFTNDWTFLQLSRTSERSPGRKGFFWLTVWEDLERWQWNLGGWLHCTPVAVREKANSEWARQGSSLSLNADKILEKGPAPQDSTISKNIDTSWGPNIQTYEYMENALNSKHRLQHHSVEETRFFNKWLNWIFIDKRTYKKVTKDSNLNDKIIIFVLIKKKAA